MSFAVARRKAERAKAEQRAKDALAEIDSIGVQVKDLEIGLLDFPCEVEGRQSCSAGRWASNPSHTGMLRTKDLPAAKLIDERIARSKRTN